MEDNWWYEKSQSKYIQEVLETAGWISVKPGMERILVESGSKSVRSYWENWRGTEKSSQGLNWSKE